MIIEQKHSCFEAVLGLETEIILKSRATPWRAATPPGVGVGCGGAIEPSRKNSLVAVGGVEPGLRSPCLVKSVMDIGGTDLGTF